MRMNITIVATVGKVIGRAGLELMKIGAWGTLNQYTQQQYREKSNHLIGDVQRGVEHGGRKLKIIKND